MQGMEAAVKPARRAQAFKSGSRTTKTMQVTPAVARNGPEPLDREPFPGPTFCLQGDRTPSLVAPKPPRTWKLQLQGPSVLESKVKALKEKMTARKQRANPCPTSYERPSPPKSKCCQVKPEAVWSLLEGSPLPDTLVVPHAQNQTDGQLDSSVNEKKPARNGGSRPSTPGLGSCNGQSLWSPEAAWLLADHGDGPAPGSGSLQESPNNQVSVGQPEGPGPCKTTHLSSLKKRRPYLLGDGVVTEGDLDNRTLTTSKEDLVPRTDLPDMFGRAGGLEALGTGTNALSLSEQVERNRLLLQEMLKVSRQGSSSVGSPDRTPSWDRAASERPAGDVDWDSGTPLQDSGQRRICVPKLEPVLSARDEGTKHLTQHARMKARTQPLRASHDIVPTIAQGSRNGQSSPALDVRSTSASREFIINGNLSDSSSVESGNGQWPRQGMPPSHVRFEDESAHEAEFRYLERRQQRQRQVLSTVLPAVGQGPLRSKPDLTNYINHNMGNGAFHRPVDSLDHSDFPAPPSTWNSERTCPACGSYLEERCPAEGRAAPDLRVLQGLQATCEQALLLRPCNSHDLSSPFPGFHAEWIRETHITDTVATHPEEGDSALNSAINLDSRTDIKDARTSQPSGAGGQIQGSSPLQWQCDSRPQEGPRWPRTEVELPWDLQAWPHLHEVGNVVVGGEMKGATGHIPQGPLLIKEDAEPRPASEPKRSWSQGHLGLQLGNHGAHPEDSWTTCRTAYAVSSSEKLGSSGSGQPDQVTESQESLETACTPLQGSPEEPSAPRPALQPTLPFSLEGWAPTLPSSKKSCPMPLRKSPCTGHHRQEHQVEHVDIPLPLSPPRISVHTLPQTQPNRPRVKHPLLDLSASTNGSVPLRLQEPRGAAVPKSRADREYCCQEPGLPLESDRDGGCGAVTGTLQDSPQSADVATVSSTVVTLSLTPEEPECRLEPHRTESSSGDHMPTGASPETSAGHVPPSATHSDGSKKRRSSVSSTLGLKKLFSALGHTPRARLGTSRSYSVEQLQPSALAPQTSTSKMKRAPSLQILHLDTVL
ncbi:uncharacterized protein KIAA1614 homolog isoform X3 [Alexandromys fortis]|uniref:uncharacterized protein KIAA1614 homolog isoform X3 n=1 Tax=Alexandromys fortis TaxID=100897 RepID=UPI002153A407|nr:uncharacterized protein KIAA1614 homolog isoform X3 [Microtus fortis]